MIAKAAIITAFDPFTFKGGIETYTIQLVDLLENHHVNTSIYHTGLVNKKHDFHNDYLGRLYLTGRMLLENDKDYDLVIANAFYGLGYFPPRVKTFNIFHLTHMGFAEKIKDVVPPSQYLEWKFLWGELSESVSSYDRIKIAVSESVKDELSKYYGFSDAKVVPHGIDTNIFVKSDKVICRRKWGIPEERRVGLYVGRWDILKGCDILEEIIYMKPDLYWIVILGTGSDKDAVPVRENVKVIEQIEHEKMNEIYSAADFMLFLSRYEGFGYVIVEAMACELPVITTNVGIAKTILKKEPFDVFLLPDASYGKEELIHSCMQKIDFLKNNRGLITEVSREGRRIIEEDYSLSSWKNTMSGALGLLEV